MWTLKVHINPEVRILKVTHEPTERVKVEFTSPRFNGPQLVPLFLTGLFEDSGHVKSPDSDKPAGVMKAEEKQTKHAHLETWITMDLQKLTPLIRKDKLQDLDWNVTDTFTAF